MGNPKELRVLSLFAGVGGLDKGVHRAAERMGYRVRAVATVEVEAFGAAVLAARMEEARLAPCPIWLGDVRDFPAAEFRGCVDLVVAGYPCQPFSVAGKQGGEDDARYLWPEVLRVVQETGATLLFCENVAGHVRNGLLRVRDDLRGAGFRVAPGLFRASDVGAPHKRERVFFVAHRHEQHDDRRRHPGARGRGEPANGGGELADRDGGRLPQWPPRPDDADGWRYVLERWPWLAPAVADTSNLPGQVPPPGGTDRANRGTPAGAGGEGGEQDDHAGRGGSTGGGGSTAPQPDVHPLADGLPPGLVPPPRIDALRAAGNAVVPAQACEAFLHLWQRMRSQP